ncbi:MAG: potassium/proton antiporter [Defluviitaleaceae bacterium]|nr:potassium/proton antiporter [Defluviitaleaceae bacterium]
MYFTLLVVSILVLLCIFSSKVLYRFGVPSLIIFLAIGMMMGTDGFGALNFHDFALAENISTVAIVLIIFYGGFSTKWDTAKPILTKAALMSSFGTIITAFVIGLFCMLILRVPFLYGLLLGSVVGSTDAASVFSILRSRKLSLKGGLAPLLEVESGSNDPFAYMMTVIVVAAIGAQNADGSGTGIITSFIMQLGVAIALGALFSFLSVVLLKRLQLQVSGLNPILLLAIVILSFSLCVLLGGNGLLCVYILGIVIGNNKILHKVSLVNFFDGLSWIMQIALFLTLGLLSFPSELPSIIIPGTLLSVLLIFVARPVAVLCILSWFKTPIKQQIFIAWVGLRGSASIVFAIVAVTAIGDILPYDLFHLVFYIALFSILIQGTFMPLMAKKLDVIDDSEENSVMKTFTDYHEEVHSLMLEYKVKKGDFILGKRIVEASIPENLLIIMIKRNGEFIIPNGSTMLNKDDVLVISGEDFKFFEAMA